MALKWEVLKEEGHADWTKRTERAKIPGGWLVRSDIYEGGGMAFVPDPDHKWDGNSVD